MILDKFIDTAVKAHRNKGIETAAKGSSDERERIQQVGKTAKPRKQNLKDASVHVCVAASQQDVLCAVVFFPFHRLFICM